MNENQVVLKNLFGNPIAILCVAIGLVGLFLGLLLFDSIVRRKRVRHRRRFQPPPETLGQKLRKPFQQVRMAVKVLVDAAHSNARRRERQERAAESMRRHRR